MTLLTIVQNVTDEVGVDRPTSVVGSTSRTQRQLLALLNSLGKELVRKHDWNFLQTEHTFSTVVDQENYSMPADYARHINDTAWDRSNFWFMRGSMTPQEWQARKSSVVAAGITKRFRVMGNEFLVEPTPTAVESLVYEYISENWTTDSGGSNPSDVFNADTDLTLFDENLLELGLKWKFLSAKGLPYAEEFRTYEQQLAILMAGDQPRYTLNMGHRRARPAANVPETGLGT